MDTEKRIEAINEMLARADSTGPKLSDVHCSIGALIIAISYLVEVVEEQQRQIDALKGETQ